MFCSNPTGQMAAPPLSHKGELLRFWPICMEVDLRKVRFDTKLTPRWNYNILLWAGNYFQAASQIVLHPTQGPAGRPPPLHLPSPPSTLNWRPSCFGIDKKQKSYNLAWCPLRIETDWEPLLVLNN